MPTHVTARKGSEARETAVTQGRGPFFALGPFCRLRVRFPRGHAAVRHRPPVFSDAPDGFSRGSTSQVVGESGREACIATSEVVERWSPTTCEVAIEGAPTTSEVVRAAFLRRYALRSNAAVTPGSNPSSRSSGSQVKAYQLALLGRHPLTVSKMNPASSRSAFARRMVAGERQPRGSKNADERSMRPLSSPWNCMATSTRSDRAVCDRDRYADDSRTTCGIATKRPPSRLAPLKRFFAATHETSGRRACLASSHTNASTATDRRP